MAIITCKDCKTRLYYEHMHGMRILREREGEEKKGDIRGGRSLSSELIVW